jgi:putative oxidoreductase
LKIAAVVSRYLLGLMFTVFGLNGFLHFIPQQAPSNPVALQFLTAVSTSHYMHVVFAVQLIGGLLLLSGRYVALALALLAPVLVNVLIYHGTMDPGGIALGLFATLLWAILFFVYRRSFQPLFEARAPHEQIAA